MPDSLAEIKALVADDLNATNDLIEQNLSTNLAPIHELNHYIINAGGKRIRPLMVLLIARALGKPSQRHLMLAVIIEFIHTATLLHDDVVDNADYRRGKETVKRLWGSKISILIGDFLYSRAFELIAEVKADEVTRLLATTTNIIAEGEVQQLLNCRCSDLAEADYLHVIYRKTAILFETAAKLSALVSDADPTLIQPLGQFGCNLGFAFQLLDDALDYTGKDNTGKTIGNDLLEGKATAPFIHTLKRCQPEEVQLLKTALSGEGPDRSDEVFAIIKAHGGIEHTVQQANIYIDKACGVLETLPDSDYKTALLQLAKFTVSRDY